METGSGLQELSGHLPGVELDSGRRGGRSCPPSLREVVGGALIAGPQPALISELTAFLLWSFHSARHRRGMSPQRK